MTEHTITKPQLLQFMHNDGSGFVAGYGREETDAFIADMESRHNAEISQLKSEFQRILDKLSKSIVDASKTIVTAAQDGLLDFYETMNTYDSAPVRTRQGNIEDKPSISKSQFDSLVSDVLEKFPDASLSECDGHPVINYHGRQFDLENTYFLSKRPDFVQLLEQDMRNFNEYVRYKRLY